MRHALAAILLLVIGSVQASVLTFDDITTDQSGGGTLIPSNYGGLNWANMYVTYSDGDNGYNRGTVSGDYVALNGGGRLAITSAGSSSVFSFDGAYLTAAWRLGLRIQVVGYQGSNAIYDTTVIVDDDEPTYFNFDYADINRLEFTSFGGVFAGGDGGNGAQFAMDNFTYSAVPIPAAAWLFGSALAGLGWMRRRTTA